MQLRDIKRRIKSISNTQEITKAMEAVSAMKMRKSQAAALQARPYAQTAIDLLDRLTKAGGRDTADFFQAPRPEAPAALLVITADKGLCGSYNSNVLREFNRYLKKPAGDSSHVYMVGKAGIGYSRFHKIPVRASFEKKGDVMAPEEIDDLFERLYGDYQSGVISGLQVFYTHFIGTLKQEARRVTLLPFQASTVREIIAGGRPAEPETGRAPALYTFEPSPEAVLRRLLPQLTKIELLHLVLEANASEHSARMVAMKNARDNATRLLDQLRLTYNKIRQELITRQISEIVGGREAMADVS